MREELINIASSNGYALQSALFDLFIQFVFHSLFFSSPWILFSYLLSGAFIPKTVFFSSLRSLRICGIRKRGGDRSLRICGGDWKSGSPHFTGTTKKEKSTALITL